MLKNYYIMLVFLSAFLVIIVVNGEDLPCQQRKYTHNSVVCVCNSTYCDEVSQVVSLQPGNYVLYTSSMDGQRFVKTTGTPDDFWTWLCKTFDFADKTSIQINRHQTYQSIIGFGGSFTDSAGINVNSLSAATQNNFINTYFGPKGLEYNIGRVPIGGSDFSTYPYAYNMEPVNDITLSNFSLSEEDYVYKIPFIQKALQVVTSELLLIGSAWSPPVWMKNNGAYGGASLLLGQYYQTWADYHLKFLQQYNMSGIQFWAITTGNEPSHGMVPLDSFNSLGWLPPDQAKWIAENLGPTIRNSSFSNVSILALDDQRYSLPWWIQWMAGNTATMQYVDGIAVHWYWNDVFGADLLDSTHNIFPDKYLISTEAAANFLPWNTEHVQLGSWEDAEGYMQDIIEDLTHWCTGWVDWNLALDQRGGPNWFSNFVDASVIAMPDADEFLKQPLFYAVGHFSKFIPRGSVRVDVQASGSMPYVAFLRPDNGITVVWYNQNDYNRYFTVNENDKGSITVNVPARSFQTLIYW